MKIVQSFVDLIIRYSIKDIFIMKLTNDKISFIVIVINDDLKKSSFFNSDEKQNYLLIVFVSLA